VKAHASRACRSCGGSDLVEILSLGKTPLANALLTEQQISEPEPSYPLDLALCRHCSLVQITETVPPEQLFRDYPYFSSFSDTMLAHARALADLMIERRRLGPDSLVVEVASNDGYLLQHYARLAIPVLGVEPALNVARVAEERGIPTIGEFFTESLASELRHAGRRADVIHAHNVLAHVPDLNGFVRGLEMMLAPGGVAVIEVPYVKDLIDRCEFDTIYHEHLCYFSLTALDHLVRRHGLALAGVERQPIHGGSLRVFCERALEAREADAAVGELLTDEERWGVGRAEFYRGFAERVKRLRDTLGTVLADLRQRGNRIVGYGASAKGTTLLSYLGLRPGTLEYVVDRSTVKQGKYTPGTHLLILPPERLLEDMPDHVLLLTWNFAEEILQQQAEFRRRGGRFIIPVPEVTIV
jgi:SAM-dependent methyltransferase